MTSHQLSTIIYQLSFINYQLKKIMCEYTAKDYKKGQPRWCPGCGDHFFLASLHKAMAEIGKAPWENAVISGIGCSSRLPYYMNTYAMQTIHGRAAAISTGAKVANPNLTVWQISGDGDGLAAERLGIGIELRDFGAVHVSSHNS